MAPEALTEYEFRWGRTRWGRRCVRAVNGEVRILSLGILQIRKWVVERWL